MGTLSIDIVGRIAAAGLRFSRRLDRDQQGTISIVTVFAVLLLTMLLGMVMNVGRQVDGKIRMQNAADASTFSGGLVLARGMNTLAFTNHMLCEVFSLTAFMREARDRNSQRYVPGILAAWDAVGRVLATSGFEKFDRLGVAIQQKTPLEQELVRAYSEWAAAASENILPLLETILQQEMIPEFQRAVVAAYPDIAQTAAMEVARHNGRPARGRGPMLGVLWRPSGVPVGGSPEGFGGSLPVVDPERDVIYLSEARRRRRDYVEMYLGLSVGDRRHAYYGDEHFRSWNKEAMVFFDRYAKMSQFNRLWRSFTCGQLHQLLDVEYALTNLPHLLDASARKAEMYQEQIGPTPLSNASLEEYFSYLGVVYWRQLPETAARVFRNPTQSDTVAYAEVRLFVPHRRLVWWHYYPGTPPRESMGGIGGQMPFPPDEEEEEEDESKQAGGDDEEEEEEEPSDWWEVVRQPWLSTQWDLFNEHWTCSLVPTTMPNLATILQTPPPVPEFAVEEIRLPNLGSLGTQEIGRISPH